VLKAAGYRGIPIIALDRDTLDFGNSLKLIAKADSILVRNPGSEVLTISSVTTSSSMFSAVSTSMVIPPRGETFLSFTVTATDTGMFSGYADIVSDDTARPLVRLTFVGRADLVPLAGVSPDSIVTALNEGEKSAHSLTLSNAGQGPLRFDVVVEYVSEGASSAMPSSPLTPALWGHMADELTVRSGAPAVFESSPPLPLVVRDPKGDAYDVDVIEIRGATRMGEVSLQVVLETDLDPSNFGGYLGLDLDQNPLTGTPLPAGIFTQVLGCEFFVTFFTLMSGISVYDSLGEYRGQVVPTVDVPGKTITFSIPLEMFNNDDGAMSIAAVFGTMFAPTDWVPDVGNGVLGISWVMTNPSSGVVSPMSSMPVSVALDAEDLSGDRYFAKVVFVTNDPSNETIEVLVKLTVVAGPNLAVTDTIRFGTVYVGYPDTVSVNFKNTGSVNLTLTSVTVNNPQFSILDVTNFTLTKDQSRLIRIRCNPAGAGLLDAGLAISSNDPDSPVLTVPISGVAALPPVIALVPSDTLRAAVDQGNTAVTTLTIQNTGLGELHWSIRGQADSTFHSSLRTEEETREIQREVTLRQGNNAGIPSVGSYPLNALLSTTGSRRVLLWTTYADNQAGGEVENTVNAIKQFVPDAAFQKTTTFSASEFASLLDIADVFIMPEQENTYDLYSLGASFAPALGAFLQSGKTMIILDYYETGSTTFVRGTGLMNINIIGGGVFSVAVHDPTSPLVEGLPSTFFAMDGSNYHWSSDGTKIVREVNTSWNVVTQRDIGVGRVIYIGMDFYSYNSDMARLLANAVSSSLGGFASVSPSYGIISPDASQDVNVTFDARNYSSGKFHSAIVIDNNDPVRNPKKLPALMTVTGKPIIQLKPDSIVGVTAYVGVGRKDTVRVKNAGSELLAITAVGSNDTSFKSNKYSFSVLPASEEAIVITTTRLDTGAFRGEITLTTNDARRPTVSFILDGRAIHPPVLTVSPDSLVVTIDEGDSTTTTLTLGNTGLGVLSWFIAEFGGSGTLEVRLGVGSDLPLIMTDEQKRGVSDASLLPDRNTAWVNKRTQVAEGSSGTVLVWSSYYNAPYWESMISMLESAGFVVVQSEARPIQPNNAYAAIFISEPLYPLTSSEVADLKNYIFRGGKVIDIGDSFNENINPLLVEFGVERVYSIVAGPVTSTHTIFQGVGDLTLDGNNWDNTLLVSAPSMTVATCAGQPIASVSADNGLLVFGEDSHFSDYAGSMADPDNIRLLQNVITWIRSGGWLTGTPNAGTVPSDQTQEVTIALNAKYLRGGDYRNAITIISNDLLRSPKLVPVHLEVIGKPSVALIPDSIVALKAYVAIPHELIVQVKNEGSGLLSVTSVTSSDSLVFKPSLGSFLVLPDSEKSLVITVTTSDTGVFRGTITLASNDTRRPVVQCVIAGHSIHPPVLTLVPDSLSLALNEGDTAKRTLTLGNAGLTELHWKLEGIPSSAILSADPLLSEGVPVFKPGGEGLWIQSPPWAAVIPGSLTAVGTSDGAGPLLPLLVSDPVGDAMYVDVAEIRGLSERSLVTLQIVLATPLNPYDFGGFLGFDLDQNEATGIPLPFGAEGQDLGCEFYATFFNLSAGIDLFNAVGNYIGSVNPLLDVAGKNFTFSFPLSMLNNDDGRINIAAVLGNSYGPTDWAPDVGHGVVLRTWILADPLEGVIQPAGTQNVTLTIDARRVGGGSYRDVVTIFSDDPLQTSKQFPIAFSVFGKPRAEFSPDSVFGAIVYIGVQRRDTLRLRNTGSRSLSVSSVKSSDTVKFKVDTSAFTLGSGGTRGLVITTVMQEAGPYRGEITVSSNDPKQPLAKFVLAGDAVYPGVASVAPESFTVTLELVDSIARALTISNLGLGPLQWEITGAAVENSIPLELTRTAEEQAAIQKQQIQRKAGNNRGTPSVGPYSIGTLLATAGTKRVLLWTGYADTTEGGEVENTMNAIRQYAPDVSFELTAMTSPAELATKLRTTDIFIMPEQELTASLSSLGTSFASALTSFAQSGKTMIVLDFFNGASTSFLNATGLLDITSLGGSSHYFLPVVVEDITSPLVAGLPLTFYSFGGTSHHMSSNGRRIIRESYYNNNVVTLRTVGAGRVIYLGMDFYSYNRDMARLISNAVNSSGPSFLTVIPGSGSVAAGGSQDVTVSFNGKYITNGSYSASIVINNSDPLRNVLIVPVQLVRTIVGVEEESSQLPTVFALHQNYPNPFNPETRIQYDLPTASPVRLEVYTILGEKIMTLVNEHQQAGYHSSVWNGRTQMGPASTGIYLVRIQAGEFIKTIKMLLVK
jgi:hypothetical protein